MTPLWTLRPANALLRDRSENEAYLAASADGRSCAIYFPNGGAVGVDLRKIEGKRTIHWFHIDRGQAGPKQELGGDAIVALKPPSRGNWAAAIIAE